MRYQFSKIKGFTLVELLVVISIIGVLLSITLLGLQSSRQSARDTKRKSDIELVRSGLEFFKTDCKKYPTSDIFANDTLTGNGTLSSCPAGNEYIQKMPEDPIAGRTYRYYSPDGITYEICASLESVTEESVTCGTSAACGTESCNYKAVNP